MLVRMLYASRAAESIDDQALDDILDRSRRNNPPLGVTGLLCLADDVFIQVLEGGRDEVCELYNTIVRDARHSEVRLLAFDEIFERRFGAWTMGQIEPSRINPVQLLKYFKRAKLDPFGESGEATMALLEELVESAAITTRNPD